MGTFNGSGPLDGGMRLSEEQLMQMFREQQRAHFAAIEQQQRMATAIAQSQLGSWPWPQPPVKSKPPVEDPKFCLKRPKP